MVIFFKIKLEFVFICLFEIIQYKNRDVNLDNISDLIQFLSCLLHYIPAEIIFR